MSENIINQRGYYKRNYRALVIITVVGILISVGIIYISGENLWSIYFMTLYWIYSLAMALLTAKLCSIIMIYSKKRILVYLPYLIMITPLLNTFDLFVRYSSDSMSYFEFRQIFGLFISFIHCFILVLIASIIIKELTDKRLYSAIYSYSKEVIEQPDTREADSNKLKEHSEELLGKGNTILDRVIASILSRANLSNRIINFSLIIMIVIVAIGGGASFGTVALNEAKKIRDLESERLKLVSIINNIRESDTLKFPISYEKTIKAVDARLGDENTYKTTIEKIEKQSNISWTDIAMRITIAALTLFLVQIFFHIYKFNQQQASQLFTKAEIMELYKESGADQNALRSGLLSKIDSTPNFEKTPPTPTEQFINIIGKPADLK